MGIKRYKNAFRKARNNSIYLKFLKEPVNPGTILLEAGQGKHTNGNVFAFVRRIHENPEWKDLTPYVAVTKDTKETARRRFEALGYSRVRLVVRNSQEYKQILATAKYLITDNSFPPYFIKRDGQIYLNTWHGTPLKRLGRADLENATSIGNVQKNFLSADYLLFPNVYTKDIMMTDYMIDRLYKGRSVVLDYPRNDALYDARMQEKIRAEQGLDGKRIIAYMPTWRGSGRTADTDEQIRRTGEIIGQIEQSLAEDELLYVNLHFLIGNRIDLSGFSKVRFFPPEYETYDFLGVCDVLISDYSSVMMDFAQLGREVIMYMYDYEEYMREKGFYFDIRTLPFKQAYTEQELRQALRAGTDSRYSLDEAYLGDGYGQATEKMLRLLCRGEEDGLQLEQHHGMPGSRLVYAGDLEDESTRFLVSDLIDRMDEEERGHTVIAFESEMKNETAQFLKTIDPQVQFVRCIPGEAIALTEYVYLNLHRYYGLCNGKANAYFKREYERLFSGMDAEEFQFLSTNLYERAETVAQGGKTAFHRVPSYFYRRLNDVFYRSPRQREKMIAQFDRCIEYPKAYGLEGLTEESCKGIYVRIDRLKSRIRSGQLCLAGRITVKAPLQMELTGTLQIGSRIYENTFDYPIRITGSRRNETAGVYRGTYRFECEIPVADTALWYTSNILNIGLAYEGHQLMVPVLSSTKRNMSQGKIIDLEGTGTVCEIKEEFKYYRVLIRRKNVTDEPAQRYKLGFAFVCHILTPWNHPVVLYEKNCNSYEESASVLFEQMVRDGYRSARFILNRGYPHQEKIDPRYRKYIVDQFSFRHYYDLFAARSIISSEALGHSLEKSCANGLFKAFILDGSKNYVFLQHGVMYMVSLDAQQRVFFEKGEGKGKQRVVVSSQREAEHFTSCTSYTQEDIYVCGLLKFDRSVRREGADRVVIMPTWRPWEFVQGLDDIRNTGYYRMLTDMVDSVPDHLKEKLIVLPHPLIAGQFSEEEDDPVLKYCRTGVSYDDILKDTKLLITDYSSISYDAFYRGCGVVFYWKDKDECMNEYGNARLMLTEDLAFGPVCYDAQSLKGAVGPAYEAEQTQEQIARYRQIVTFHDGCNARRFIAMAKKDGIL